MRGMFHAPAEVAERSVLQPSRLGGDELSFANPTE
jgi:hypothetical protein